MGVFYGAEFVAASGLEDHGPFGQPQRVKDEHLELDGIGFGRLYDPVGLVDEGHGLFGAVERQPAASAVRDLLDEVSAEDVNGDGACGEFQVSVIGRCAGEILRHVRVLYHGDFAVN